jgi:hypothetical protein
MDLRWICSSKKYIKYKDDAGRKVEEELCGGGRVYGYVPSESVEAPCGGSSAAELDEAPAETDEQG